jgi:hypothetical protein
MSDRIAGADKLISVFGYWPSFHDAEVVRTNLDRRSPAGEPEPTLEALIHTWEVTREVDLAGYYVSRNHVLVHLRFRDFDELKLEGFNAQNVLFGLKVSDAQDRHADHFQFQVEFNPSHGLGAHFLCRAIEVVAVTPCGKDGIP